MSKTKRLLRNGFWLSLLLHLLLLLSMTTIFILRPEENKKPPHYYVPSYVYKGAITPAPVYKGAIKPSANQQQKASPQQNPPTPTDSHQYAKKNRPSSKNGIYAKSMMAASLNMLKDDQLKSVSASFKETDPIYMIGDENEVADPLIKMMGRSLSKHFAYPRQAGLFGIKGKVLVELTLHPEGYYSDVRMVQSSDNQDLDAAALYAVNNAPNVDGADRFLSKPKHFVVGFVFY